MAEKPLRASYVRFLPIVASYARKLGVVEEIDRLCSRGRGLSPGRVVLALILDALSGRSPLFRLPDAFAKLDSELLLGQAIAPAALNDDAVGRVLDRIYEVGTGKVLSAVAVRAVKLFDLKTTHVHHDTTSRPTAFMLTTKFPSVIVLRTAGRRFLAEPLDSIQQGFLAILGLSAEVFPDPEALPVPQTGPHPQSSKGP